MFRTLLVAGILFSTNAISAAQDDLQPPALIPQWVVLTSTQAELLTMTFPNNDTSVIEPYTITIPFVEKGADGKEETKFQTQVQLRQRKITAKEAQQPKTLRWRVKDLSFLDLKGTKLDFNKDVLPRITKPTPVMAVAEPSVDPFFAQVLKEDTIIVVVPTKR